MKIFKLVWKFGKDEYVKGNDIVDACNKSGIGGGNQGNKERRKGMDGQE